MRWWNPLPRCLAVAVLIVAGCGPEIGDPVRLRAVSGPQDALFYAGFGWVGGCGDAVIGPDRQIVRLNRTPVFLDDNAHRQILQAAGNPTCIQGGDSILVSARVKLVKDSCTRPLPVPDGGVDEDRVDFLRLVIIDLHEVITDLTPCK